MGKEVALVLLLCLVASVVSICPFNETGLTSWSWNEENGKVTIPAGQRVLLSSSPPKLDSIVVAGSLIFDNQDINLDFNWMRVESTGEVLIGSEEAGCQITKKIVITMWGERVSGNVSPMGADPEDNVSFGSKGLGVCAGATFEAHGFVKGPSWTRLSQTSVANTTTLHFEDRIYWKAGDSIVIATTDFPGVLDYRLPEYKSYPSTNFQYGKVWPDQTEERIIVSVASDGLSLEIDVPLNFTHWGEGYEKAEVGLLTRHIVIQGDPSSVESKFGGHLMLRRGKSLHISGVEVTRMGQLGILGRYPVHWHLVRDVINMGYYTKDCSIHHNFQRCLVVHATDGLLVKDNVAYNTNGHCYFLEDGAEVFNVLDHNLGINPRAIASEDERQPIPTDNQPTVFWITNPNNTWTNNAAVGGKFGYWFALPLRPMGVSVALYGKDPLWARGRITPLYKFEGNVAHSCYDNCLQIDQNVRIDGRIESGSYNPLVGPFNTSSDSGYPRADVTFSKFTAYKSRSFGVWGKSNMRFTDVVLLNNRRGFMVNGVSILENSLIIGETDNIGSPRKGHDRSYPDVWGSNTTFITGHETYDNGGPQFLRNVTFRNFVSTDIRKAAAISVLQNGPFLLDTENVYVDLKFENANIVYLNLKNGDAPYGWTVLAADDSITGIPGGSWLVSPNAPHMIPSDVVCEYKKAWNTVVCPPHVDGYVQVNFRNNNGPMPASDGFGDENPDRLPAGDKKILGAWFPAGSNVGSDGGPVSGAEIDCTTSPTKKCWQFMANTLPNRMLTIRFYNDVSFVKTPQSFSINMESSKPGDWIIVSFPLPKSALPLNVSNDKAILTRVFSACELNTTTYLYSGKEEHLYVMLANTKNTKDFSGKWGFTDYGYDLTRINVVALGCDIDGCPITKYDIPPVNQAMIPPTENYKLQLSPCAGSDGHGTGFFRLNPLKKSLKFAIYHDISDVATKVNLYNGDPKNGGKIIASKDFGAVATPIHGFFTISHVQWQLLHSNSLYISIHSNVTQNHLCGQIVCTESDGCLSAPAKAVADPCNPTGTTLDIYDDSLINWIENSWSSVDDGFNTTVTLNETDSLCGTNAIRVKLRRGAFSAYTNSKNRPTVDPEIYKYFEFWCKLAPGYGETTLKMYLDNGKGRISTSSIFINPDMITNWVINSEDGWTRVMVPLSTLNVTAPTPIARFVIALNDYNSPPKEILFDKIRFITEVNDMYSSGSDLKELQEDRLRMCEEDAYLMDYGIGVFGMPGWQIAIIVVFVILAVAIVGGVAFYFLKIKGAGAELIP